MVIRSVVLSAMLCFSAIGAAQQVNITRQLGQFEVNHQGQKITIQRNQDTSALLEGDFALTSRPCPPFCAQPMRAADGVETIGEVELMAFMQGALASGSGVLVDARTPDWFQRGTIPGSINIPFADLNPAQGADDITLADSLELLGVKERDQGGWDFSGARQVVLWCNGPWCGQSPTAIRGMLSIGYPADLIFYYRGGMQLWRVFGLPVVLPDGTLDE